MAEWPGTGRYHLVLDGAADRPRGQEGVDVAVGGPLGERPEDPLHRHLQDAPPGPDRGRPAPPAHVRDLTPGEFSM
jgi:hypothetical protein